jgi:4-diphosphocytidyl-2-C-methyl-D-erythritol kinase
MAPDAHPAAVTLAAPAKLNLFLDVLGKRPDGYHDLATCMVPLSLADTLAFAPADTLSLTCDDPRLSTGPENLVMKAAELLRTRTGCPRGAAITLTKRIPMQAGLGGGSSDAATTLLGLNELWDLRLGHADLLELAGQLGSDVPFFLARSAAWCTGRGEVVVPFDLPSELNFVLLCPGVGLSTAAVFRHCQPSDTPMSTEPLRRALAAGDAAAVGRSLFNRLQAPAEALCPAVARLRQHCEQLASRGWWWGHGMTGSGSTYFVLARDAGSAQRSLPILAATPMEGAPVSVYLARSRPPGI